MLEIDVLTIFPELFGPFLETAFVGAARRDGAARVDTRDVPSPLATSTPVIRSASMAKPTTRPRNRRAPCSRACSSR